LFFFKIKFNKFLDGSCNGDSGVNVFRDSLAAVTKYSRCKPLATVNFVGENSAQASIVSRFELIFYRFFKENFNLVLNLIEIMNILLLLEFRKKLK